MSINAIRQVDYPNNVTILEIRCPWCGKISEMKVSTKVWLKGLTAYKNGALIQHAWPSLLPAERELILTGICGSCDECWNNI